MLTLFSLNMGTFFQIILAGLFGAFVGLEREIPRPGLGVGTQHKDHFGGLRSFALISMIGALTSLLDVQFGGHIFILLGFISTFLFIGVVHTFSAFKKEDFGVTTELAAILVFFIGILTMLGGIKFTFILTFILTLIMSAKSYFEGIKASISREEIINTLKFAVIAFVILPLLPDEKFSFATLLAGLGFEEAKMWTNTVWQMAFFNPYSVWFFVVAISSVEYVGYILSRIVGRGKSVVVACTIGGLVSSTAVTATMSEQSKADPENAQLYVVGTLIANSIMFLRVIVIVLFFNASLISVFLFPALIMFAALALATLYFAWSARHKTSKKSIHIEEKVKSPFSMIPALKFGGFVLFVKFVAEIGLVYKAVWGGNIFYYVLGVISGLADVDAISQTMSTQSKEGLITSAIATSTVLIAVMTNNLIKSGIAFKFGGREFGKKVVLSFLFSIVVGVFGIIAMNMMG